MFEKNNFGAYKTYPAFVSALLYKAIEHHVCSPGIKSDRKQRGTALNIDVVGWNEEESLAVMQVRECVFHPRRYNRVRKDYYLVGHNENGTFFAHSIESPMRSVFAKKSPENCVSFALAKIWDIKPERLNEVVRQGDVAFVPVKNPPQGYSPIADHSLTFRESHKLSGELYMGLDDRIYTKNAALEHTKGEHETIKAEGQWYRLALGVRAETWGFSEPTID